MNYMKRAWLSVTKAREICDIVCCYSDIRKCDRWRIAVNQSTQNVEKQIKTN